MKSDDLLYYMFKDVTPEVMERAWERWNKNVTLETIETPFGTLRMLKNPLMPDNEVQIGNMRFRIEDEESN